MEELRLIALNGMLGYGYDPASLAAGIATQPHLVGGDCGSTDAGPYYLGAGQSLVTRQQVNKIVKVVT